MNKTDYKDMWVFIERDGDSVLPVSLELCSETRRLCDASGEKLVAVIVGSISDGELQRVLDCGVDKVIHVTGTGYDYFNNDAYTNLFTVLCRKYRPTAVMVGGTINGRDFAPRFAARLGTGCTSDATELVWDPKTTDIEFVEPAVGGKMMAVITVPVALYQIYAFAKPGLKRSESFFFKLVLLLGLMLFCVGILFAYKVTLPFMLNFLVTLEGTDYITASISIESYINLCLTMFIIFGCVFEMPLVTIILAKMGIANPEIMKKGRGVAIVLIFLVAAIITPPDIVSQCFVAVPMCLLYFISIFLSGIFYKPKTDDDDEDEDDEEESSDEE